QGPDGPHQPGVPGAGYRAPRAVAYPAGDHRPECRLSAPAGDMVRAGAGGDRAGRPGRVPARQPAEPFVAGAHAAALSHPLVTAVTTFPNSPIPLVSPSLSD